jgi:peptidoglycan/LPS O-acetylase OafA/YrhL
MTPSAILPAAAAPRYHALDGLRGAMMLLGIYLHVVVAYAPLGGWPFKQPELTGSLIGTVVFIHIFRMPVFYVMAGFFAALLYARYGVRRAIANRAYRIVVPFVVGWLIVFPLVILLQGWGKLGLARTWAGILAGTVPSWAHPLHLWFLEYLLVFYCLALVVVPAAAALPTGWRAAFTRCFRAAVSSAWAPALFAVPSFLALLPMRYPGFDDPPGFVPAPRIVIAYAIPFAFGWLLYHSVDLLDVLRRRAWTHALWVLGAGGGFMILVALYFLGYIREPAGWSWLFFVSRALHAVALWGLIFAITGLFLRYLSGPNAAWRYLCDSSYFLYIAHMPVVMALQIALLAVAIPPLAKAAIVLVAATAVLLAMYHYLVRPTAIGAVLNGRRYPIRAAVAAPATA